MNALGSVAWGESSKGVLNKLEKFHVVENLEFVMSQEQLDADRRRLGLLNPKHIPVETLTPPDSKIVKDALAYAEETHVPSLLRHSWRTYYFGALIASHDGIEFDRELAFTAAILHDLGLTASANPRPCDCCFAVGGALQARDFLLSKGHSRGRSDAVAHAISVHLNIHVPVEEHGALAFLVTRGAVCDVFGAGVSRMSSESIGQVLAKYSREGLSAALRPTWCQHLAGTRIDVLLSFEASLNARGQTPQNPLDADSFT
jgi:HD domain